MRSMAAAGWVQCWSCMRLRTRDDAVEQPPDNSQNRQMLDLADRLRQVELDVHHLRRTVDGQHQIVAAMDRRIMDLEWLEAWRNFLHELWNSRRLLRQVTHPDDVDTPVFQRPDAGDPEVTIHLLGLAPSVTEDGQLTPGYVRIQQTFFSRTAEARESPKPLPCTLGRRAVGPTAAAIVRQAEDRTRGWKKNVG